jgi:Domain of unknown function (DUF4440)
MGKNIARLSAASLCVTFVATAPLFAQSDGVPSPLTRELIVVAEQVMEAAKRQDRAAFDRLVAADFGFGHTTGNLDTRDEYFQRGKNSPPPPFTFDEPVKFWIAGDLAVMTAVAQTRRGSNTAGIIRTIDVFQRSAAGWQWAFHQGTRLPGPLPSTNVSEALLREYEGTYIDDGGNKAVVTRERERLTLAYDNRPTLTLGAETESTFVAAGFGGIRAVFLRGKSGQVSKLEILQGTGVIALSRATQ